MNYGLIKFSTGTHPEKVGNAENVYNINLHVYFEDEDEKNYYHLDELQSVTKRKKKLSKSSQPSTGIIKEKMIEALNNHEYIFVLTPSRIMSGTHQNTLLAREMLAKNEKERVNIIETQAFGISEYITSDLAFQLFNMNLEPDEIEQKLLELINDTCSYGCISSCENLRQGGRFDVSKYSQVQLRRMKAIVYHHNFKKGVVGIYKSSRESLESLQKSMIKEKTKRCYFLSVREKKGYRIELSNYCKKNKIDFIDCGEASTPLATQIGFGSFVLGFQK